ncbi:MAG: branched-chain amino acid ABC transporter permease [Chloroflexi bacterium]|nr:branched-chain amino acid ABC transporter permease [Chloroflexota bacterium]
MALDLLALQILNGLVTGAFYAMLALGLAMVIGMLRVVNFAHGAFYMLGAFAAYILKQEAEIGLLPALTIAPIAVAIVGMILERTLIRRLYGVDPVYHVLLTFGLTLILQDGMRLRYGIQSQPYGIPPELAGTLNVGFLFYPTYRLFIIVFSILICVAVWYLVERTRIGLAARAATETRAVTEKGEQTRALGVSGDHWITLVFGLGVGLAALAGVLAAPTRNVSPLMGSDLIVTVFAVVVIGGSGSIVGAVVAGFLVGVLSAIGSLFFPPLTNTLAFIMMAAVLLIRPAGLFGTAGAS